MKKLLPQANTLATVIRTFKFIANTMNCSLNDIADFNKFEVRQAAYYSNACYFLELIDENLILELIDENLKLTSLGEDIMQDPKRAKVRIYEQIIKNELIGQLFAKTALYPRRTAIKEGKELVRGLYPEYGEAVIDRRTKCLIGWCEEIIDYMKTQKNS